MNVHFRLHKALFVNSYMEVRNYRPKAVTACEKLKLWSYMKCTLVAH